jgi:hypothetical protein
MKGRIDSPGNCQWEFIDSLAAKIDDNALKQVQAAHDASPLVKWCIEHWDWTVNLSGQCIPAGKIN